MKWTVYIIIICVIKFLSIGLDPENFSEHKNYIDRLCGDFEKCIKEKVEAAILDSAKSNRVTSLEEEVAQHLRFCQEKCRVFSGRVEPLKVS